MSEGPTYEEIAAMAEVVKSKTKHRPKLAIICGSGLGGLADLVTNPDVIPYSDIPGFPVSTVSGHVGTLEFGVLGGKTVLLMRGRVHTYEGYPVWKTTIPVRVMKLLGITTLILTNAAGGVNRDFNVGDIMIIKDHIDLPGLSGECVLRGRNDDRFGPRFLATVDIYDTELSKLACRIADGLGLTDLIRNGVYIMIGGPTFETVAETRLLNVLGADAVGMSTVPEAVVAHHSGMKVFGISLITDLCSHDYGGGSGTTHAEVLAIGEKRAADLQKLVTGMLEQIDL